MANKNVYEKMIKVGINHEGGDVEIRVEFRETDKGLELSMVGDSWMKSRRDIISGGQMQSHIFDECARLIVPRTKLARMIEVWERWHLNGMRAGCSHQRADATFKPEKELTLVTYRLTTAASLRISDIKRSAEKRLIETGAATLSGREQAFLKLPWEVVQPVDAPHPGPVETDMITGPTYKEEKREKKTAGWVYPKEHPEGLLGKPCSTCGYKYGSAWLYEELPPEIVAEVKGW